MRGFGEQEILVLWNPRRTDCRYIAALAVWECEAALRRLKYCGASVAQGACTASSLGGNAEVIDIDVYIPHTIRRNKTLPPNRPLYIARDFTTMATVGGWLARLHDVEGKKATRAPSDGKTEMKRGWYYRKQWKKKRGAHPSRANETSCPLRATHTTRSRVSPGTIYSQGGRNTNQ